MSVGVVCRRGHEMALLYEASAVIDATDCSEARTGKYIALAENENVKLRMKKISKHGGT